MDQVIENNRAKEHWLRAEATKRAGADPLPGPAGDAFGKHGAIPIGSSGISVRRVVASDWQILKSLDSPIIKMLLELRQNPTTTAEIPIETEEEWELAFQFTRPVAAVREALAQGRDKFREQARGEVGDTLDESVVSLIRIAVLEQIRRSWSTAVSYRQEMEEKGEVHFFPVAEENPKMASAGGSST